MEYGQPFNPWKLFNGIFIPNWLKGRKEVSNNAKLVYGQLAQFAGKENKCFPSLESLGEELGSSTDTIGRGIKELTDEGLLASKRRGLGQSNEYLFLWHPWIGNEDDSSSADSRNRTCAESANQPSQDLRIQETAHVRNQGKDTSESTRSILQDPSTPYNPPNELGREPSKQEETQLTFKERRDRTLGRQGGSAASYSPPSERRVDPVEEKVVKILCLYETLLKYPVPRVTEQRYHIKQMLNDGYTVEDIIGCYKSMKKDEFWKIKDPSMKSIEGQIGSYLKREKEKNAWKETLPKFPPIPEGKITWGPKATMYVDGKLVG